MDTAAARWWCLAVAGVLAAALPPAAVALPPAGAVATPGPGAYADDGGTRSKRQEVAEICDFGSDVDITLCDWSTRNVTPGQAHLPRWEGGAGTLSNWIGGPPKDAGGGESTDKGGYAFFETSLLGSPDGRVSSSASLESAPLETTGAEGKCLTFSYAIDGLSAAGLRVLLRPARLDGGPAGAERELWAARDSSGKQWLPAAVLYTFNTEHQVVFEGLAREASDPRRKFRGHVAVDDIALKAGSECRGHCTFEGGLCGWVNDEDDDFDWTLGRGSRNPSTGPATDRSSFAYGGLQGGYAYIDSSFPRRPGDMARLSSAELEPTGVDGPLCLRFWTHMYGNGVGTLSVQLTDTREEGHEQVLWTLSGESGNAWYQAQVTVSSANPFRIVLVGRVGRNSLGDIAVDDVSLSTGSCPTAPQVAASSRVDCTFEVDECGWVNVAPRERRDDMDWERVSGAGQRSQLRDHTVASDKGRVPALQQPGPRLEVRPGGHHRHQGHHVDVRGQLGLQQGQRDHRHRRHRHLPQPVHHHARGRRRPPGRVPLREGHVQLVQRDQRHLPGVLAPRVPGPPALQPPGQDVRRARGLHLLRPVRGQQEGLQGHGAARVAAHPGVHGGAPAVPHLLVRGLRRRRLGGAARRQGRQLERRAHAGQAVGAAERRHGHGAPRLDARAGAAGPWPGLHAAARGPGRQRRLRRGRHHAQPGLVSNAARVGDPEEDGRQRKIKGRSTLLLLHRCAARPAGLAS